MVYNWERTRVARTLFQLRSELYVLNRSDDQLPCSHLLDHISSATRLLESPFATLVEAGVNECKCASLPSVDGI